MLHYAHWLAIDELVKVILILVPSIEVMVLLDWKIMDVYLGIADLEITNGYQNSSTKVDWVIETVCI